MKNAAKVLDLIAVILAGVGIVGNIVCLATSSLIASSIVTYLQQILSSEQIELLGDINFLIRTAIVISFVYELIIALVGLALGIVGAIRIFKEEKSKTPHIFMIVCGALCGTPFGVVGGILGLIALRHDNNTPNLTVEKPKEEIIVEVE